MQSFSSDLSESTSYLERAIKVNISYSKKGGMEEKVGMEETKKKCKGET
jgi:hypothetical protein